jgi:hypothetical protein
VSVQAIRAALEQRLNAMSPALAAAWENATFTPQTDVPYQKVNLLRATPDNPMYGPAHVASGFLQITLMYPQSAGPAPAEARAELVRTTFPRGSSMTSGGITVTVQKTPEIGPGMPDGDRWALPVRIRYFANVTN